MRSRWRRWLPIDADPGADSRTFAGPWLRAWVALTLLVAADPLVDLVAGPAAESAFVEVVLPVGVALVGAYVFAAEGLRVTRWTVPAVALVASGLLLFAATAAPTLVGFRGVVGGMALFLVGYVATFLRFFDLAAP